MLQDTSLAVSTSITEKYGITIPWDQIIEIIIGIIEQCFNNEKDFVSACKDPSVLQRIGLRIVVRRTLGLSSVRAVTAITQALLDSATSLTEDELASHYQEAKAIFNTNGR